MKLLSKLLLTTLTLLVVARYVPGISISGFYAALVAAIFLGLLNLIIKPILLILTLPVNILTLGLFSLVINGALFWFAASFLDGFAVASFWSAFIGSLIVSVVNSLSHKIL